MPTNYIKKLSKQGKGTVPDLEKDWDRAERLADKQGQGDNYAYRTAIFKNLVGAALKGETMKPNAVQRLKASNIAGYVKTEIVSADNAYLDSLVDSGQFTREQVDDAWAKAKERANKEAEENPNIVPSYAYTTAIFQDILGIKDRDPSEPPQKVGAATRLKAQDQRPGL